VRRWLFHHQTVGETRGNTALRKDGVVEGLRVCSVFGVSGKQVGELHSTGSADKASPECARSSTQSCREHGASGCTNQHRSGSGDLCVFISLRTHTMHTFNGPSSKATQVSRYQKGKTNLDFTEARESEWQWHQLGHMQVCTSLQTDNHASTLPLSFLQAGCPSCCPTNSLKACKAQALKVSEGINKYLAQYA